MARNESIDLASGLGPVLWSCCSRAFIQDETGETVGVVEPEPLCNEAAV